MLRPSSKPTHTPTASDGVYPINHASRKLFVVPDFAATGPRYPRDRSERPVPRSTAPRSAEVTRYASAGENACFPFS